MWVYFNRFDRTGWGGPLKEAGLRAWSSKRPCLSRPAPKSGLLHLIFPCPSHQLGGWLQRSLKERAKGSAHCLCRIWYLQCCRRCCQLLHRRREYSNTGRCQMQFLECLSRALTRSIGPQASSKTEHFSGSRCREEVSGLPSFQKLGRFTLSLWPLTISEALLSSFFI